MQKKIYTVLIICILLSSIALSSYSADLNELQEQKNEIESQINETNAQLTEVNEELTENLQHIMTLDEDIIQTENTLDELNNKIKNKENEINKIESELRIVTDKYNTQKQLLDSRLLAIYESKDVNYWDVVLGSNSISDFISTYYLIEELTTYDMDLLELVKDEKNKIEDINNQLNIQKNELQTEKTSLQKTQIALTNSKILRENYVSKLSDEEQELQSKIDEYNNQVNLIEAEIRSLASTINFGEDYLGGSMQWPIIGHYNITSNYGMRVHPITGVYKLHTGVDISASIGTDFTAIANGVVVKAEYNRAYGNMVIIDHGGGVQTLYAHGSEIIANVGQTVNAGDVVLKVGSTGYSTGPHAHFEVRINGQPVNPLDYVSKPE